MFYFNQPSLRGLDAGPSPRTVVARTVMLIPDPAETHDDDATSNELLQLPSTQLEARIMSEPNTTPETESE